MNFDDSIEAEQGVTGTMLPAEQGVAAGMSAAEQGVAAGMPAAEQASAVTTEGAAPATKTSVDAGSDNKELDQGAHGVNQDGNQEDDEENAMDTPNVDTCLESGVMDERVLVFLKFLKTDDTGFIAMDRISVKSHMKSLLESGNGKIRFVEMIEAIEPNISIGRDHKQKACVMYAHSSEDDDNEEPCTRCARGKGPFAVCRKSVHIRSGRCINCYFWSPSNQSDGCKCTLETSKQEDTKPKKRSKAVLVDVEPVETAQKSGTQGADIQGFLTKEQLSKILASALNGIANPSDRVHIEQTVYNTVQNLKTKGEVDMWVYNVEKLDMKVVRAIKNVDQLGIPGAQKRAKEDEESDDDEEPPKKKGKAPAKKTPAKKTPAKKAPAKKTPAKKTPAKKTPAKKTPA